MPYDRATACAVSRSIGAYCAPAASYTVTVNRAAQATYTALPPARVLDSRTGNGLAGAFVAGAVRTLQVTGRGGVPAGAKAVTINVTVVGQSAGGYLSVGPALAVPPATSTLNFPLGDTRANGATVALAGSGSLAIVYIGPAGARTHVVIDVTGYFD